MNIAILGFGTVGTGVAKIIEGAGTMTKAQSLNVSYVFVRPGKEDSEKHYVSDYDQILNDDSVDVVVEVLGGIEPAHTMIIQALKHGKHVVTANKAVVARYLAEFLRVADENNVRINFEASVGGGIPWIINVERGLRIDQIDSLHGIFNGTTNYILDQMTKHDLSFEVALQQAQELGYAEADPSGDIDGDDIENKLCISVDIAYDTLVCPNQKLPKFGIRNITAADISYCKQLGGVIKLVGRSERYGDDFSYVIEPTMYQAGQIETSINNNFNYISFHGNTIGDLGFFGQGAGMYPTAHAVIQDILDINLKNPRLKLGLTQLLNLNNDCERGNYLLRFNPEFKAVIDDLKPEQDGNYFKVLDTDAQTIHDRMRKILKADARAFMVRLNGGLEDDCR